jgi:hypothetical protein
MLDILVGTGISRRWQTMSILAFTLFVLALVNPLTSLEEWVGWLPSTVSVSELAAAWLPMVACGFAAWIGGQSRAHGMQDWTATSSRTPARRIAPTLVLVATSVLFAQAASLIVLSTLSIHFGLMDRIIGADLLLSVPTLTAYVFAWVAIGAHLGRSIRREIALPLAVLLPYAIYAVFGLYLADGSLGVFALGDNRIYDYVRPATGVVVVRAVFWIVVASSLWTWLLEYRRTNRTLSWLASIAAAVAIFQGPHFVPLTDAFSSVCAGSSPVTCLDVSHGSTMGRYRRAVNVLWPSIPTSLRPAVLASSRDVAPSDATNLLIVPPVKGNTEPSRLIDQRMFAARLGDELFLSQCTSNLEGSDTATSLDIWWRLQHHLPLDGSAFAGDTNFISSDTRYQNHLANVAAFTHQSETFRDSWFKAHRDQVLDCTAPGLGRL